MPIKFRCHHCQQLLGISQSKAGEVVDCPSCGRGTRVPGEAASRFDATGTGSKHDPELVDALNALANLGGDPTTDEDETAEELMEKVASAPEPMTLPEPVAIAPAKPAVAVPVSPASPKPLAGSSESITADDLPLPVASPVADRERTGAGWLPLGLGLLLGLLAGYFLYPVFPWTTPEVSITQDIGETENQSTEEPETVTQTELLANLGAVTGRISYRTIDGGSRPDRGARVLLLPERRAGTGRIAFLGLRAGANPTDVRLASESLRVLGGGLGIVDEEGRFSVPLTQPGTYHVLVISRYQPAADDVIIDSAVQRMLDAYLLRSTQFQEQVLEQVSHHFSTVRFQGGTNLEWDHTFDRPI